MCPESHHQRPVSHTSAVIAAPKIRRAQMRTATIPDVPVIVPDRVYTLKEAAIVTRFDQRTLLNDIYRGRLRKLPAGGKRRHLMTGQMLLDWLNQPAETKAA